MFARHPFVSLVTTQYKSLAALLLHLPESERTNGGNSDVSCLMVGSSDLVRVFCLCPSSSSVTSQPSLTVTLGRRLPPPVSQREERMKYPRSRIAYCAQIRGIACKGSKFIRRRTKNNNHGSARNHSRAEPNINWLLTREWPGNGSSHSGRGSFCS